MEQADDVLKPYYKTIRSLLNLRNEKDILHIFREENMECVWYSHDNWNGGIDYYHLQINTLRTFLNIDVLRYQFHRLNKDQS